MTANQADKTNDSNVEETTQKNTESSDSGKSSVAQLRDSYRETKQELQSTRWENKELKEKLASIEDKIAAIDEIKEENQKIQEQLAQQTLQQEKQEQKAQFFNERPHLKEVQDEIESNVGDGNFEQDALLYLAKNKPQLLTETSQNKKKTKQMKVSGTPANGTQNNKDIKDMSPSEYLDAMRERWVEI